MLYNAKAGTNSNGMNWILGEDGVLTIEGEGKIPHYDCGRYPAPPWKDVREDIIEIHIMDGITEIGIHAFKDCSNLKKVVLPHSLYRIHAYAFWNCEKLENMISDRTDFKFVYDDREYDADRTLIFGVESFYKVPWSIGRWGDFYIRDGVLYHTFSKKTEKLVVPEGVTILNRGSMNYVDVGSIVLPQTLEEVEDYTFLGSVVKEKMKLPDSVSRFTPHAFARCSIIWENSQGMREVARKRRKYSKEERKHIPGYFSLYSFHLLKRKTLGNFRILKIKENRPSRINKEDGSLQSFVFREKIDVGASIYRRLRNDKVITAVLCESHRVSMVISFLWNDEMQGIYAYLLYPAYKEGKKKIYGKMEYDFFEDDELKDLFYISDGKTMVEEGKFYSDDPEVSEAWFSSDACEYEKGETELELLKLWMSLHPEVEI